MLEEKIYKDYVEALKSQNKPKTAFLSYIRAEIKNAAIHLKKDKVEDAEVIAIFNKQIKRLEETKESAIKAGKPELIEQCQREMAILGEYLPKPLEEGELVKLVDTVIAELNAATIKDMGRVMKEVLARAEGKAEAKKVSEMVRSKLTPA